MISFDQLMPDVLQSLFNEGIDEESFNKNRAMHAIRRAYRDFIRKTHLFKRTWVIDSQANVNEYELFQFDDEVVVKIYSVKVDGCCYNPGKICACNCCHKTFNYDGNILNICPAPECDGQEIEVCVSVVPSMAVCEMEDRVAELYGENIVSGAVHNLLSKKASGSYQVQYDAGVAKGGREAARQWSTGKGIGGRTKWIRR